MPQLTREGLRIVDDLAQRHGFSTEAVAHMLLALKAGNGSMAQFNHPEFAGSGQWMQGGMVMLSDMFNNSLKGRVDNLCQAINGILVSQPGLLQTGSFQSQSQGGGAAYQQATLGFMAGETGQSALFAPDPKQEWWPNELGSPNAIGSQNSMSYAYFASSHRLAVKINDSIWVYDTLDHRIGGFSQQQGAGGNILFSSQYGSVDLSRLPVVWRNGQPVAPPTVAAPTTHVRDAATLSQETDIFSAIERLGDLKAKGILTDEEFMMKKAELLRRL